ncbi:ATP-grasp fold amidoligase family protein [Aliivibrio fischeri]|uniref:ATP-grasp fold amidoligase family protein n=1 Tax=Aliivibrio fischeri TaxID=668 RepID=UPI0012DA48B7|nr:ATP-grasp fold amidoligase family protein [Aliivibrio fischeri]MUK65336.1 hypothetical protein [Aliivibrio fischeri]
MKNNVKKTIKYLLNDYNYDRVRYIKSDLIYVLKKNTLTDKKLISDFYNRFGYSFDLDSPSTFNEKLLIKRLKKIGNNHHFYADKLSVRKYISECVGDEYLIPLIDVIDDSSDIDISKYKSPFIAKAAHASSLNQIVKDPNSFSNKQFSFLINKWLKRDYGYYWGEWYYSDIKPKVVLEQLLVEDDGDVPADYKFHVFYDNSGGYEIYIQVDLARFKEHKRDFYSVSWEKLDISYEYENSDSLIKKPDNLSDMIDIVLKISKPFQYSRIDLYNFKNQIFFGEITFIPEAGRGRFNERTIDEKWGRLLRIDV